MKNLLILFLFGIPGLSIVAQDDIEWRIMPSLTDWIEEINTWPDSVYVQKDLKILIDLKKDKTWVAIDSNLSLQQLVNSQKLLINKPLEIDNIQFGKDDLLFTRICLGNLVFNDSIKIDELKNARIVFTNCDFRDHISLFKPETVFYLNFINCNFESFHLPNPQQSLTISFDKCDFKSNCNIISSRYDCSPEIRFDTSVIDGSINLGGRFNHFLMWESEAGSLDLQGVIFENYLYIVQSQIEYIQIDGAQLPINNTYIPFKEISNRIAIGNNSYPNPRTFYQANSNIDYEDQINFDRLIASYSMLLSIYQARGAKNDYNACYVEMREKQTAHSLYLYQQNPSFSNYSVYKLNAFMGTFSDYGTRPTKAIIISIYVILFFSLIYLFFPNNWDSHGRNRIIDRYNFFFKYMKRKAGIHEVYLEDQQDDLMSYEQFKANITSSEQKVPSFFIVTALPLYKWAISGTKLTSSFLKRVDIMKGTWEDVPDGQRWWKGILLIGAFSIAIIYDIMIKMLNALMLSINTFTTLGFGEIPIKGLPRYLAIIQGFIGWFMLTIFSVSLISQLLN